MIVIVKTWFIKEVKRLCACQNKRVMKIIIIIIKLHHALSSGVMKELI